MHERTAVKSLQESRQQNVALQEWDLSCGAAALATVLRYQHNDPVPEKTIAESMLRKTNPLDIAGSSAVVAMFNTGFSLALSPRVLLGIEAGIGLTERAPDFRFEVSLPIRL